MGVGNPATDVDRLSGGHDLPKLKDFPKEFGGWAR